MSFVLRIDGTAPGFPVRIFVSNDDSSESFDIPDPGTASFSIPVSDNIYNLTTVGVDDVEPPGPQAYSLGQNYPNTFNPFTTIPYAVSERSNILLTVYAVLGREVATLVNGVRDPVMKTITFDAASLPSGVYTYWIVPRSFTDTGKMVFMK